MLMREIFVVFTAIGDFMGTPKKVIEADRCFICSTVVAKKEKLHIFGKSSIDVCEIY